MPPHAYDTIIVDDQEIDRLTTAWYVRAWPFLSVSGLYGSAADALEHVRTKPPAVMLLDVDMPGTTGLELRRQAQEPACIFITAFPDYAVEGFEQAALDFLVKPLDRDRFAITMRRLQEYLQLKDKADLIDHTFNGNALFVRDGHDQVKIPLHEVLYLEALKDYTSIVTPHKKYCILAMLGNLLKEKPFSHFIRIHRSYAVQPQFVDKITASEVNVGHAVLPVGRTYKYSLQDLPGGHHLNADKP